LFLINSLHKGLGLPFSGDQIKLSRSKILWDCWSRSLVLVGTWMFSKVQSIPTKLEGAVTSAHHHEILPSKIREKQSLWISIIMFPYLVRSCPPVTIKVQCVYILNK